MLLARKAKKSWHRTYMPGKAGLLLPWLPQKSGQGRAFQGWVAKVAIKARLWPGLTGFSRPYFSGKPGQKPGKPGLAGLCQACRAFGRTPDAREAPCWLSEIFVTSASHSNLHFDWPVAKEAIRKLCCQRDVKKLLQTIIKHFV